IIRERRRNAVALHRMAKIFQLLFPRKMRIESQRHILPNLVRLMRMTVADLIGQVDLLGVKGLGVTDLRQRGKSSLSDHGCLATLNLPGRPRSRGAVW